MKASFLALLCVSVFAVTDAAAEITVATSAQPAALATTTVTASPDNNTGWLKRKNKKRRPAYRRLRAHRR
jgi:hypothetical protein